MMVDTNLKACVVGAGEGRRLWHLGALLNFKALGNETNGRFWALEGLADRHMAVPLHIHTLEDEFWYVLEGEICFTVSDKTINAGPGTFAYIPMGTPHTFQILTDTARWFGVGTPAGLEQWFFETGEPAKSTTLPPPPTSPPDVQAIVSNLLEYGIETVGPLPGVTD